MESETDPLPAVTAMTMGPSRVFDIDRNTVIHIGGLGVYTQVTNTHAHIRCIDVCEQVITVCVIPEPKSDAVLHVPGLSGGSITQREKHWTVELQQQRGRVWRLL